MYSKAPLFEEPFAQTLSGKKKQTVDFRRYRTQKNTPISAWFLGGSGSLGGHQWGSIHF